MRGKGRGRAIVGAWVLAGGALATAHAFDYADVIGKARQLAALPFKPQRRIAQLAGLSYDEYRSIHFRPTATLWPRRRLHLQFFAPGYRFVRAVSISLLAAGHVHALRFRRSWFHIPPGLYPHHLPRTIGYAGFRVLYNGYHPGRSPVAPNNQVIVFLGASYFRAKGSHEQFGLSARALAVDTIAPRPEEFPHFIAFWIRRPAPRARALTVFALLNGPSVTGALRFRIHPGRAVHVRVRATFFFRRRVYELGMAPLSSMYMYDLCDRRPWAYPRPAAHDSEGFLLASRRAMRWRQLANPARVHQFVFPVRHLRGFGLIQRDRDFFDYESISMRYQGRPSVWIRPRGAWGPGKATLIEIPTPNETNDNIVAFWQPARPPAPGRAYRLRYTLIWNGPGPRESRAQVVRTRASARCTGRPVRFAVDFQGARLGRLVAARRLAARLRTTAPGTPISHVRLRAVAHDRVRLCFTVAAQRPRALRIRAVLIAGGRPVSEVWDYVVARAEPPIQVLRRPRGGT
ncbi:glucan biosynthesis protein G [Acidiferrobacter sp. SPIII_3]|uniref:glucan biosynthesis protein n=1 Tax=Acidiferrobacter sp. SPIII_3 TaxID=1281578 RepID=UPI000D73D2BE|nr:glucan biosynthesis protein [Acidiferrobacter sp. SPIII_3]AWP23103.1 glucan biosynthesis protein G [Acidiferrobacter sp. SPIII_3]